MILPIILFLWFLSLFWKAVSPLPGKGYTSLSMNKGYLVWGIPFFERLPLYLLNDLLGDLLTDLVDRIF